METGFIQWELSSELTWVPKLLPLGLAYWKDGAEILHPSADSVTFHASHALLCRPCKKVLMDYGSEFHMLK